MNSPCTGHCLYDHERDHCKGCGRTLYEIQSWWRACETKRRLIVEKAKERLRDRHSQS